MEQGVTDTGQGTHQGRFQGDDRFFGFVSILFFNRDIDSHDQVPKDRIGIEKLIVGPQHILQLGFIVAIEFFQDGQDAVKVA